MASAAQQLLTADDVAALLGISRARVYQLIREGQLQVGRRLGRCLFFERKAVRHYELNRRPPGRPPVTEKKISKRACKSFQRK